MRVKVESIPPLPTIKAWFGVHSASTVSDFKSVLCSDLPALRDARTQARDILLVLEDYELLDASPVDVVRDGDLIFIKRNPSVFTKRRRDSSVSLPRKRSKKTRPAEPVVTAVQPQAGPSIQQQRPSASAAAQKRPTDSDSSTSPSSEEESESSSSHNSNSSAGSDSSSESESSSESASSSDSDASDSESDSSETSSAPSSEPTRPGTKSTKAPGAPRREASTQKSAVHDSTRTQSAPPVPPGFGKPATKSRNLRRRRKKIHERLAATEEPASVNAIPLGTREPVDEAPAPPAPAEAATPAESLATPTFMMASLSNKNKRKGFKRAMASHIPKRIVFEGQEDEATPGDDSEMQETLPYGGADESVVVAEQSTARLVPPSEKQELGLLPPNMFVTSIDVEEGLPSRKRKRKVVVTQQTVPVEDTVTLDYGEPLEASNSPEMPDVAQIEARWESYPRITDKSQVQPGMTVAWKALGINRHTFTPEFLLNIAQVMSCGAQLVLMPTVNESLEEVDMSEAVKYHWDSVMTGDWHVVQPQ
ncbi:hypothetical protein CERSUDRAFT_119350 [Gelatoporia subvermispora B]|uniref:Uncharacterized protein n=1 Tax=Ceriporiopsis subvermispora (strain B) TaxID=914234 RepID=M2R0J1_CERS8|nr:hypothetical protein CERSUDRAFT_119350 [Gelatoporia subvermispora B]